MNVSSLLVVTGGLIRLSCAHVMYDFLSGPFGASDCAAAAAAAATMDREDELVISHCLSTTSLVKPPAYVCKQSKTCGTEALDRQQHHMSTLNTDGT